MRAIVAYASGDILIEPFVCSAWCVKRANIQWDTVVLAGAGTLGLRMVGAAKLHSPKRLVVMDPKPERLELAKSETGRHNPVAKIALEQEREQAWGAQ